MTHKEASEDWSLRALAWKMATALAPPPSVAEPSANGDNIGEAGRNEDSVPSNISVVSTSKEEGLEKAADTKEYDYPDGGLRGEYPLVVCMIGHLLLPIARNGKSLRYANIRSMARRPWRVFRVYRYLGVGVCLSPLQTVGSHRSGTGISRLSVSIKPITRRINWRTKV